MKLLKSFLKSWPSFLVLALVLAGLFIVFRYFNAENINAFIERAGLWAPLALIAAKASTIVIAPLGGAPLYPLSGALFGFWKGYLYLILGDTLGITIAFFLSRTYGRRIVDYFFPDHKLVNRVLHALGTTKGLVIAQISFISFPELVCYAAGLTRVAFLPFILITTSVSIVPRGILVALGTLLTDGRNSFVFVGLGVAAMGVLGLGTLLFSRYMRTLNPDLRVTMGNNDNKIG
ncbi:hypothetical protein A2852_02350 [Candidatus Adlerbacteria bacterium RIFCSPHIGHO2_01_FULL_54_23]|uniref:TVP38/TMEM64 family membrane protein n=3 Tax=Candidatus Adleribacteriota TaxID=1752736 RepID=A0A1F4Y0T1_9BACT|nr:MAG: hypothetical protein UY83_C0002G0057 [Candidatus Adlerbacteria bacterium GW2011_GWA1_54_10]KKW37959.1 MAG: hypothetical protein UY86_C0002G0056 [Candidatus Adlerbacteria bacterium GW2011_GWB1_54_7]OGC78567.1 MAG: hypothetical protein A2852_02350 [Candidatus Adlerbacteria bacterium RIFCSPHIGHO2_01_FULL_54_23]OGC87577.1 MAG: hypothetical protein A3B33_01545 [Candidatus Adlerbacteria bacterium RIFCSPLOWO2_01_FULL_54_16]